MTGNGFPQRQTPKKQRLIVRSGTLMAVALLAGCALQPPTPETPAKPLPSPAPQKPGPREAHHHRRPPPPCAWTQTRGVAKLVRAHGGRGWFRFYPGNRLVPASIDQVRANPGAEYTAILKKPLYGPCHRPDLELVSPLP